MNTVEKTRQRCLVAKLASESKLATEPKTFGELSAVPTMRTYFGETADHVPAANDTRPSAYLRDRCPACAGGSNFSHEEGM